MPLSPWVYAITPTTLPVEPNSIADLEEDESTEDDEDNDEDLGPGKETEQMDPALPRSVFNFKNAVSFKADIEATSKAVTTYQEIMDRFFDSERKIETLDSDDNEASDDTDDSEKPPEE